MVDCFEAYKTDYLFLLIGTNPLPNYVAALLLAKKEGKVILLHSGGAQGTFTIADNLERAINKRMPYVQVVLREIDEKDGGRIVRKIAEILTEILKDVSRNASLGLNYTGGTKAMSVHVHRAIKIANQPAVFSYLDARELSLLIDASDDVDAKKITIAEACNLQLKEILSLHGYCRNDIKRDPVQPDFCRALAEIYSSKASYGEWKKWLEQDLTENLLPSKSKYPLLTNVINVIDALCDGKPSPHLLAHKLGRDKLISCKEFLDGKWLDEYTFCSLQQIADELRLKDVGFDLVCKKPRHFELDVVFVRGYQLFALSCKSYMKPEPCKLGLFEAYVRARQIGGDEARVGLVCCYERPDNLRREVEEAWFAKGRVKVFGMNDLLDLPEKLKAWILNANCRVEGGAL